MRTRVPSPSAARHAPGDAQRRASVRVPISRLREALRAELDAQLPRTDTLGRAAVRLQPVWTRLQTGAGAANPRGSDARDRRGGAQLRPMRTPVQAGRRTSGARAHGALRRPAARVRRLPEAVQESAAAGASHARHALRRQAAALPRLRPRLHAGVQHADAHAHSHRRKAVHLRRVRRAVRPLRLAQGSSVNSSQTRAACC